MGIDQLDKQVKKIKIVSIFLFFTLWLVQDVYKYIVFPFYFWELFKL